MFEKLKFFPIERMQDNDNADNMQSIKSMIEYAGIKGKVGIFPEGTTLKNDEMDFNVFHDSFVKMAALTNAVIQPVNIYWFRYRNKLKPIVNLGDILVVQKTNMSSVYDEFMQCQKELLEENKNMASNFRNNMCRNT